MSKSKKIFLIIFALFIIGLNVALPSWLQSLKAEEVTYLKDSVIERLTFDNQNRLYVMVNKEFYKNCPGADELRVYENGVITHTYTEAGCYKSNLKDLIVDSSGRIWINWESYVAVGDGENWSEVPLKHSDLNITTIAVDSKGKLWVGTYGDGLFIVDGNKLQNYTEVNSDLLGKYVTGIAFDNQDRAWITSFNYDDMGGVNIFDGENWQSYTPENSQLLSNVATSITFDKQNRAWIGSDREIAVFDGRDWTSYSTNGIEARFNWHNDKSIINMVFDGQERVWANDTSVFDGKTWKYYLDPYHLGVNDTAVDKDGNVWVATDNGVVVIRPGSPQPVSYATALIAIAIASDISIYITLLFLIVWVSVAYNAWKSIGYSLLSLPVFFIWIIMNMGSSKFYSLAVFLGLGGDNPFVLNPAMFGTIGGIIGGATEIYFKRSGSTNTKRWGLIGFVAGTVLSFCVMSPVLFLQ